MLIPIPARPWSSKRALLEFTHATALQVLWQNSAICQLTRSRRPPPSLVRGVVIHPSGNASSRFVASFLKWLWSSVVPMRSLQCIGPELLHGSGEVLQRRPKNWGTYNRLNPRAVLRPAQTI